MDNDLPIRQPISVTTREPKEYYNKTELLTYEYLLEIFEGDGSNVVNPLVNRCIIYENKIEELQKDIDGLYRYIDELKETNSELHSEVESLEFRLDRALDGYIDKGKVKEE
jgi:hypothetical protein